jgi:transposase
MSTYAKVRRLFHRDHLSISEIQRRTSLSRNTIKAWLKVTSPDGYKYPKPDKPEPKRQLILGQKDILGCTGKFGRSADSRPPKCS